MGIFSKKKIQNDREIINKIQFELINNSNIEEERIVLRDIKFPYESKIEYVNFIIITKKGVFTVNTLTVVGEYIGGQFENIWSIGEVKIKNPINIINQSSSALREYLKLNSKEVIPYIVLNNLSTIRDIPMISKKYRIVWEKDLYYFLGLHTSILPDIFDETKIKEIKRRLDKTSMIQELYNS